MGKPQSPQPTLLFTGILYNNKSYMEKAKKDLINQFGPVLIESPSFNWGYSEYYREELGWPIIREFIFFKNPINPGDLADIKLKTNSIEDSLSVNGKRKVNLDPGYLTLSNVVLATTKNYSHRIYLSKGIYAEVTLIYKDKTFVPHIFTYPDYQDKNCIEFFLKARNALKTGDKNSGATAPQGYPCE